MQVIDSHRALVPVGESKGTDPGSLAIGSGFSGIQTFVEFLVSKGAYDLSAHMTLMYYRRVAPVFDGVDRISDEVSGIRPVIFDQVNDKYIEKHPLLTLLNKPNPAESGTRFLKAMCVYYLICGNEYVVLTGNPKRPPLELYNILPTRVSLTQDPADGYLGAVRVASLVGSDVYERNEVKGTFRYLNREQTREIIHMKEFNPGDGIDQLYGMSKLTPAYYEIEQWLQASIHNLSLLRNGATPSGVLSTELNLSDDQYTRLQKELQMYFMGARNAGRPMIVEGGMAYNKMGMSNKDMDFMNLKDGVRDMIYNVLRIPLPLVSRAQMTMNNMDNSRFIFYDNAVLPTHKRLMDDLGDALLPRYGLDPSQYRLSYIPDEIPSLAARHAQETQTLNDMGKLTDNEIRARLGYGELDGGDVLYHLNTEVPLGTDEDTSDEAVTDEDTQELNKENPDEDDDIGAGGESPTGKKALKTFIKLMRNKKDGNGDRLYTDAKIADLARRHGLITRKQLHKLQRPRRI